MLVLDQIQTLACGGVCLLAGQGTLRLVPDLKRLNIPAPVIGGLLAALTILAGERLKVPLVSFDTALQTPLMIAFFTTIGCNASFALLKASGGQVMLLLGLCAFFALVQALAGMAVAVAFGLHPLFGVLAGTATLAGGPATGLAFAPLFEHAGVTGAAGIAIASAMAGIVSGGLFGGPVATWLVARYHLRPSATSQREVQDLPAGTSPETAPLASGRAGAEVVLRTLVTVLVAMWVGSLVSAWISREGVKLPAYIGAMIIGAALRNLDDLTGWLGLTRRVIEDIGSVCLAFFLSLALMNLKLWQLSGLALPLLVNLAVQIVLVGAFCFWPLFQLMGRDYDSAVIAGGFVGFMLGITANAIAVMQTLVERYGPAPRAFLVAPLVGAFFIDFTNSIIITAFINLFS